MNFINIKKNIKKMNAILIILLIILSILNQTIIVSASGNEIISIGSATLDPGETVVISISIANVTEIESMSLDLVYDHNIVSIINITANKSMPSSSISTNTDVPGNTTIVMTNSEYITATSDIPLIDITIQANKSGMSTLEMKNVELSRDYDPYPPGTVNSGMISINEITTTNGTEIISIGSAAIATGETVVIPITIANATEIKGVRLDLVYDHDIVSIINITANKSIASTSIITYTDVPGNRTIVLTNSEYITATSDIPLIDITIQANKSGMSTLEMKNVELSRDYDPYPPGTVNNGKISINETTTTNGTEIISIGSAAITTGEIVVIPITIANATEVEGVSLDLVYDHDIVSIINITANESIPSSSITANTDVPGNATIVLTNSEYITATSDTPLIDITFQANNSGISVLDLKNVELTKDFTPYPPGTVNNGEISINETTTTNGTEIISIGSAAMAPGETVVIPVTIANATEVEGVSLDLVYDHDIVSIINITANESIPSSSITTNTDVPGNATMVLTNFENITATSNTPLIDITFQAQNPGISTLELKNVKLTKDFIPYPPETVNDGEITIIVDLNITISPVTSPTNLCNQTITGTMAYGATVTATCPTASVGIVTSNVTTWSVEITDMSEGENVITATATDQAGNIKSTNVTIILDTDISVTIDPVDSPTNINSQTITGTMKNGSDVVVTCPTASVGNLTCPNPTTWSVEITDMSEGMNMVTATATDKAGNTNSTNVTIILDINISITIDPVTSPTNINSQTITGTMNSGSDVVLTCPTASVGNLTYPNPTTWSVEITNMSEGENIIAATATDQAGNKESTDAIIILDTTVEVSIDPVTSPTNINNQTITGTVESGANVVVTCPTASVGILTNQNVSVWSVEITDMSEGENMITSTTTDRAGNTDSDNKTIILDTTEPYLILDLNTTGDKYTLYINSRDEELINCTVTPKDGIPRKCDNIINDMFNWWTTLEQNNTYTITGTDFVGNKALRNFTLESRPIADTTNNQTNVTSENEKIEIEVTTTSDLEGISDVMICEYNENPVESLNSTTTDSLYEINKFVQIEVDPTLNDNISIVRISVSYRGSDLSGIDEETLRLHYWNTSLQAWEEIPGNVDVKNKIVWGEVDHFSLFSILGQVLTSIDEDTTGRSSSGGDGGVGVSNEPFANIWMSLTKREYVSVGSDTCYCFDLEGFIIEYINFTGQINSGRIATKVEVLKDTSRRVDTTAPDIVYMNLNIWVGGAGWARPCNIADSTITFVVEKNWTAENNIDKSSICMYRYSNNDWQPLETSKIGENADYLLFESKTPGYSHFAVSGKESAGEPGGKPGGEGVDPEQNTSENITVEATTQPEQTETKQGIPGFCLFSGLLVVLIAVYILQKKY